MKPEQVYHYIKSHIESGAYDVNGNELSLACPDCGDESHFSVNIYNGKYNCFKCPVGGRLATIIINNRLEWKKLTQNLIEKDFLSSRSVEKIYLPENSFNVYNVLYPDSTLSQKKHIANSLSLCQKAYSYCTKRGLSKEQIRDYRIYVCPGDPRVYFPYWNKDGEIVHYMGRKMMGDDTTMKTKDSVNSEKPLFGRHVKVIKDDVILVEGVFDHFATPQSYALMGSSIGVEQMLQLRKDGVSRIFVVGDPDASKTADSIAKKLRNFKFNAFPVNLHASGDPGDLGKVTMVEVVDKLLSRNDRVFKPIHISLNTF